MAKKNRLITRQKNHDYKIRSEEQYRKDLEKRREKRLDNKQVLDDLILMTKEKAVVADGAKAARKINLKTDTTPAEKKKTRKPRKQDVRRWKKIHDRMDKQGKMTK
mmetsp:Transcript_12301/g.21009  ORF Transcript_12301/g.21009 Transcript_12301/m.21009 type:complete len:106 (-) Transcript_12301:798-1115(-)